MRLMRPNRWALSMADLTLLMLAMMALVMQHPDDVSGNPNTQTIALIPIEKLFVGDEAMLSDAGQAQLQSVIGERPLNGLRYVISVGEGSSASMRLNSWELAAARTAVVGRYFVERGFSERNLILRTAPVGEAENELRHVRIEIYGEGGTDIAE